MRGDYEHFLFFPCIRLANIDLFCACHVYHVAVSICEDVNAKINIFEGPGYLIMNQVTLVTLLLFSYFILSALTQAQICF